MTAATAQMAPASNAPVPASADPYEWHDNAMKGVRGMVYDGEPQTGWYRNRRLVSPKGETPKRYEWDAVAYWKDSKSGEQRCHINGRSPTELRALEVWIYANKYPISEDTYHDFLQTGQWPETNAVLADQDQRSNAAPDDDSFEGVRDRIDALVVESKRLMKRGAAKTKAEADAAADVAVRLGELFTLSDRLRKKEKQPHLDAGREVDSKWNGLRDEAAVYKDLKQSVVQPWLDAENARLKQAAEEAEKERLKKLAEEAEAERVSRLQDAPAMEMDDDQTLAPALSPSPTFAPAPAPAFTPAKAGTQKTVSSRVEYVAVIDDYAKALAHFAEHPDIKAVVQDLANKQAKAKMTVPGCRIVEHGRAV